jgi:hypothetical protein
MHLGEIFSVSLNALSYQPTLRPAKLPLLLPILSTCRLSEGLCYTSPFVFLLRE